MLRWLHISIVTIGTHQCLISNSRAQLALSFWISVMQSQSISDRAVNTQTVKIFTGILSGMSTNSVNLTYLHTTDTTTHIYKAIKCRNQHKHARRSYFPSTMPKIYAHFSQATIWIQGAIQVSIGSIPHTNSHVWKPPTNFHCLKWRFACFFPLWILWLFAVGHGCTVTRDLF